MVAWVVPAIAAGLSLMSSFGQSKAAKSQERAHAVYQEKQRAAAWENYRYQTRQIQNRYAEEAEATAYQVQDNKIKNLEAQATAKASAAGSGVTGSTIENLFKDYDRASAASNYVASRNLTLKRLQTVDETQSAYIQALNVSNGVQQYQGATSSSLMLGGIGNALSMFANTYGAEKNVLGQLGKGVRS